MNQIVIFTDGSSKGNPGPGGYGIVLKSGNHRKEISEGFRLTTNNRMELLAVIIALEAIKSDKYDIKVYTDSKYVSEAVTKGWIWGWEKKDFKGKKNKDLWKRFIPLYKKYKVSFHWLKGHAGHPENERCDRLAVQAAEGPSLKEDSGYISNQ